MTKRNTSFHKYKSRQKARTVPIDIDRLFHKVLEGDKAALAQGITLIESTLKHDLLQGEELVTKCLKAAHQSIRIGITGVPGVGKSTFIEAFGSFLTASGKKVAVLAVDPSSSITKGSILGDKTRMERLSRDPNAFIRPSPAQDSLGGVARRTRESILLCEAAGYEVILVETVGVGQSETLVHSMVDFFLLLKLAGAGDELQGVKRGIMEMADAVVINKADGENLNAVKYAMTEFQRALHLYPPKTNTWMPKVLRCSSLHQTGIDTVWQTIQNFIELTTNNGHFESNRDVQYKNWFTQTVDDLLQRHFFEEKTIQLAMQQQLQKITAKEVSPVTAARELVGMIYGGNA